MSEASERLTGSTWDVETLLSDARSRSNTPAPRASQMNAWTPPRSQASSERLPRLETAGSSSSRDARQTGACRHTLRKSRRGSGPALMGALATG